MAPFHCPKFLVAILNIYQPLPSNDWSLIMKNQGPSTLMSCFSMGGGVRISTAATPNNVPLKIDTIFLLRLFLFFSSKNTCTVSGFEILPGRAPVFSKLVDDDLLMHASVPFCTSDARCLDVFEVIVLLGIFQLLYHPRPFLRLFHAIAMKYRVCYVRISVLCVGTYCVAAKFSCKIF